MRTFYSMVEKIGKSSQFIYEFLTTKLLLKKFLLFREFKLKWSVKIMMENRTWKTLDPKSFSLFLLFSLNIYELIENYSTWVAFLRIVGVFINSGFLWKITIDFWWIWKAFCKALILQNFRTHPTFYSHR